jgi:glycyl-tRNA synthetase
MQYGELLPYVVIVANGPFENLDVVRHGNEQVLRARYADATFFFQSDSRKALEDFLPRLGTLTFQEQLGSVLDKVGRLERLAPELAQRIGATQDEQCAAVRAAHLCKADLGSKVVVELTSLQGVMGSKYALRSGEPPAVAKAISEHYLPRGAGDAVPQSTPGVLVGLSDRLDSLVGLFAVGLQPTGSADPYGLRRAALGLVQILTERHILLSLREAFGAAAGLMPVKVPQTALSAVHEFVTQRLRGWLLEQGYRYDLVDAALAERADNPHLALETVRSLSAWVDRPEFAALLTAYSRPSRIVRDYPTDFPLHPELFGEAEERALYAAVQTAQAQRSSVRDVDGLMAVLGPLARPIDAFFAKVFVMVDDQVVRENRLALLQRIAALSKGIVDLTKVLGY